MSVSHSAATLHFRVDQLHAAGGQRDQYDLVVPAEVRIGRLA